MGMAFGVTSTTLLIFLAYNPAAATAIVHLVQIVTSSISGASHIRLGNVDWHLLALLVSGSLPGIWLGSRLLGYLNPLVTRGILSTLLAAVGIKLMAW